MYIRVKYKLGLVLLFTFIWFSTSLYLAQPWIDDLTASFGIFIAWFIVIGLALIPGCGMSFLVASILLDKRPHYPENLDLPPISILIAAYNEEESIVDTLSGISEQHYPEKVEVIVINDGSSDNTLNEIQSFIARYSGSFDIKTVSMEKNSGKSHNPRLVFDRKELDDLKSSISKVGILVPLTVYENKKSFPKSKYIILDGERRWRCAKELGFQLVPANVIDEPEDVTQNILFMFNIHHYRREWALFPTALKLQVIIDKLGTDRESTVSEFTGVSRSTIRRCKALLWYPEKYRDVL